MKEDGQMDHSKETTAGQPDSKHTPTRVDSSGSRTAFASGPGTSIATELTVASDMAPLLANETNPSLASYTELSIAGTTGPSLTSGSLPSFVTASDPLIASSSVPSPASVAEPSPASVTAPSCASGLAPLYTSTKRLTASDFFKQEYLSLWRDGDDGIKSESDDSSYNSDTDEGSTTGRRQRRRARYEEEIYHYLPSEYSHPDLASPRGLAVKPRTKADTKLPYVYYLPETSAAANVEPWEYDYDTSALNAKEGTPLVTSAVQTSPPQAPKQAPPQAPAQAPLEHHEYFAPKWYDSPSTSAYQPAPVTQDSQAGTSRTTAYLERVNARKRSLNDNNTTAVSCKRVLSTLASGSAATSTSGSAAASAADSAAASAADSTAAGSSAAGSSAAEREPQSFNDLLESTVTQETDVSRILFATLILASAGNVELIQGEPLEMNSFGLRLLTVEDDGYGAAAQRIDEAQNPPQSPPQRGNTPETLDDDSQDEPSQDY